MSDQTPKEKFPPSMEDIGIPEKMSPIEEITSTIDKTPMVEIIKQEHWEISDDLSASEIRQEEI